MIAEHVHDHFHRDPGVTIATNRAWISRDGEIMPVDWHRDLFGRHSMSYADAWDEGWARVYGLPAGEMGIDMRTGCSIEQFRTFQDMISDVQPQRLYCYSGTGRSTFSDNPETFRKNLGILA